MPDTKSPLTRRELIEHLAPLIWQDRQREAEHYAALHKQTRPPYYFFNLNHPTIKRLSLLHPAVLRMLAEEYDPPNKTP